MKTRFTTKSVARVFLVALDLILHKTEWRICLVSIVFYQKGYYINVNGGRIFVCEKGNTRFSKQTNKNVGKSGFTTITASTTGEGPLES